MHAGAYRRMKGVEIAGFYGRHRAKVAETAQRFHTTATTDAATLIQDGTIDAIDVVTPSACHRDFVVAALDEGKHVFCETPLALRLEDADSMLRASRRAGRLLLCAQLMRFVPEYVFARETAVRRRLGAVTFVIASRLSRPYWSRTEPRPFPVYGEPVVELMTFDFNFLNWVLGRASAVTAHGLRGGRNAADLIVATVRYPGALGVAEGSARMPPGFPFNTRLRVLFDQGLWEADFRAKPSGFSFSFVEFSEKSAGRRVLVSRKDPYFAECEHFVACVRGKADPSVLEGVHDRDALRVALAARESLGTGRSVPLRT